MGKKGCKLAHGDADPHKHGETNEGDDLNHNDGEQSVEMQTNDKSESQGGLLYLTLVAGQCQRWKCIEGAQKHGFVLLRRGPFRPPPAPLQLVDVEKGENAKTASSLGMAAASKTQSAKDRCPIDMQTESKTFYKPRRHQCGKSFANRRSSHTRKEGHEKHESESETLVFGRTCDYPLASIMEHATAQYLEGERTKNPYGNIGLLPWEQVQLLQSKVTAKDTNTEENEQVCNAGHNTDVISQIRSSNSKFSAQSNIVLNRLLHHTSRTFHECKYCDKSFQEQRSLKNHMMCCHPNCEEVHAWALKKKSKRKTIAKHVQVNNCEENGDWGKIAGNGNVIDSALNRKRKFVKGDEYNSYDKQFGMQQSNEGKLDEINIVNENADENWADTLSFGESIGSGSRKAVAVGGGNDNDREANVAASQGPPWICVVCESQREKAASKGGEEPNLMELSSSMRQRIFPHEQALLDHQRAKHYGDHLDIKPDWCHQGGIMNNKSDIEDGPDEKIDVASDAQMLVKFGSCPICDLPYSAELDRLCHEWDFLPSLSVAAKFASVNTANVSTTSWHNLSTDLLQSNDGCPLLNQLIHCRTYKCQYCSKNFRELRSQRQHENFCSVRRQWPLVRKFAG